MSSIALNPVAIALAAIAIFFISYLWYSVLFGRIWAQEMNLPAEQSSSQLAWGLSLTALGAALMSFVLASSLAVIQTANWGQQSPGSGQVGQAFIAALLAWAGFVLPALLHRFAWEKPSWRLLAINGGYYLSALFAAGSIIAFG